MTLVASSLESKSEERKRERLTKDEVRKERREKGVEGEEGKEREMEEKLNKRERGRGRERRKSGGKCDK